MNTKITKHICNLTFTPYLAEILENYRNKNFDFFYILTSKKFLAFYLILSFVSLNISYPGFF